MDEALYRVAFVVCAAFAILPFWSAVVLPFQDYAGNMSYAAILAGAMEDGSLYDTVYHTGEPWFPNGLLFYSWAGLGELVGFVPAGKILLSLYALGLPVAVDRLLAATGRDRAFALLAFPLVFNSSLMMGFVGYATSLPLAVYAMARAWRFLEGPTWGRGAAVTALAMLTFLGHAQMYLVLGLMALTFVAFTARSLPHLLILCAPFAASLVLFFPWAWAEFVQPADPTALGGRELQPYYQSPEALFGRIGDFLIGRWTAGFDDWVLLGMFGVALVGLVDRRADRQPGQGRARYAPEAVSLVVFGGYLVIPEHTVVQAAIGSRLVAVAAVMGIVWLHPPGSPWVRRGLVVAMAALTVGFGTRAAAEIRAFERDEIGADFLTMIDALPAESRLALVLEDRSTRYVKVHPHEHVYGYHFGLNGGVAYSSFHSYHGRHAWWRSGREVPWPGRDAAAFLRGSSACSYDYLLLRSAAPPAWRGLSDRVTYRAHSARYTLWALEHDRIPACAPSEPEEVEPEPPPPTEERPGQADRDDAGARSSALPLPDTMAPEVGRARGRSMDGSYAPSERARKRQELERTRREERATESEER